MNADRLLVHYERIADATDAIPRLRRFILDLAVRGKLVRQDPNDEPASELLKRIAAEKARLVNAGEIKKQEPMPPVGRAEQPFDLQSGWCATRLAVVAVCLDYMRRPINGTERDQRIAGKPQSALFPYFGATQQQGWIDNYIFDEELVLLGEDGVPFFDQLRSKAYLIAGKSWVNNHAHVFRGILVSHPFLVHCLNVFDYSGRVVGATRSKLNQARAVDIPIMLPPLAEQHRIVAKVDELMTLCDRLEAARAGREAARDRLVAASLARLDTPDPVTFQDDARFAINILPVLTTRSDQIKQLRQIILNLAVRGKLVPQDPMDEPASELLTRIHKWQLAAMARKQIRAPRKPLKPIREDENPYLRPDGWAWARLGDIIYIQSGDGLTSTNMQAGEIPVFGGNGINGYHDKSNVNRETIVIGRVGYYCGSIHVTPSKAWVTDNAFITHFCDDAIELRFLVLLLNGTNLKEDENATAQPVISGSKIYPIVIGLPPIAEQQRIVAKVDELMALCDQLEASLEAAATTRRSLLDALLAEALALGEVLVPQKPERVAAHG